MPVYQPANACLGIGQVGSDRMLSALDRLGCKSERVCECNFCLKHCDPPRRFIESQVPRILVGLVGLVAESLQSQALGSCHLLEEASPDTKSLAVKSAGRKSTIRSHRCFSFMFMQS
jgi:hypothetical protein